jgi:hypothetical protein
MAADPLDETAHRWYMSAAAAVGEQAKALAAYAALSERLGEQLGTDPAPQTRELHLAILREQPVDPAGGGGRGPVVASPGAARAGPDGAGRAVAAVPGADGTAALGIGGTATGIPGLGRIAASGPALAGRDTEIGALRAAWHAATGGEPGLVMIVGEAGIGKTALAELIGAEAEADGATVLRTRCYETERSLFLQPVIEAIMPVVTRTPAAVLGELFGEHAPAAAALLPEAAALLGPSPAARSR